MATFRFTFTRPISGSRARLGELTTPHGTIQTPAFIFCATKAAIKCLNPAQMKQANTQIILSNTYHLMLQPGSEIVKQLGGLHRFMNWNGPMLTDSGGFQIFSLGHGSVAQEIKGKRSSCSTSRTHEQNVAARRSSPGQQAPEARNKSLLSISEEGAIFRSYLNGDKHLLTPEKSIQVQRDLGADLIVVLDECTPFHVDKEYTRRSMEMSHRWALRSNAEFQAHNTGVQALYGIIQGGVYEDLRQESCDFVNSQNFFGHAIGGSLGADKAQMAGIVDMTARKLDERRPIHLLGIGGIQDIFEGVMSGIDTFDCVHPTRIARHGGALVKSGHCSSSCADAAAPVTGEKEALEGKQASKPKSRDHINLLNSKYKTDQQPIDQTCDCYACQNFSRGYLHHLLKSQELLGIQLITMHNVRFMNKLMEDIRDCLRTAAGAGAGPAGVGAGAAGFDSENSTAVGSLQQLRKAYCG